MNAAEVELVQDIRSHERRRLEAMLRGSVPELDDLLSEDVIYGHSLGTLDDKRSYLEKIASRANVYEQLELEVDRVIPLGETALVNGLMRGSVRLPDRVVKVDSRFMTVWHRSNGKWRLVGHQTVGR